MKRYTKKLDKPVGGLKYCINNHNDAVACTQKLGKLEDLEEQLGMPLEELFINILGRHICYLDDDYCESCRAMGIQLVTTNESIFSFTSVIPDYYDYIIITDSCWTFRLSDYGKSWFLDEEEAEKALEARKNEV